MYPKISDFFNDLFGTSIVLPIQSYGFFLALAFVVAYFVIRAEFRRQTRNGVFPTRMEWERVSGPMEMQELLLSVFVYVLLGYKLFLMVEDYGSFAANPQEAIISWQGSWWGALLLGLVGGGYKFYQYWQRRNVKEEWKQEEKGLTDELGSVLTIAFVGGIVGAKVFHNLEYWDEFVQDPVGQFFSFSGLTFYGGLITAAVALIWFVVKRGYQPLPFADAAGMAVILAYGVGRIGCQVAGDGDWGVINNAPKPGWLAWAPDWLWAYNYPNNVLRLCNPDPDRYTDIVCNWAETPFLVQPVFPTPLYETLMAATIFGLLWILRKRVQYWGQLFGLFLLLNGMERFLIEQIRVNRILHFLGMQPTQAEIIASGMMLGGLVFLYFATFVWKKNLHNTPIQPVKPLNPKAGK